MQKIFEYIGLITLIGFSFFITEKTTMIVMEIDEIMIQIKKNYKNYESKSVDAIILDDKIIPGICGKKVDIEGTYKEMQEIGIYDESLYKFNYIYPNISLYNNYNKFIIRGNPNKKNIYVFIELDNYSIKFIDRHEFKNFNFIIEPSFYKDNKYVIEKLIKNNNAIIISDTNYLLYKQISKEYFNLTGNKIYCYSNNKNHEFNNICSTNKSNIILEIDNIDSNLLLKIKQNLKNGKFLKLSLNDEFIDNFRLIEKYISSKGMELSTIDVSLKEC